MRKGLIILCGILISMNILGQNVNFYEEEVKFFNETDSVNLAGTLTIPEISDHSPAVVLITGSGPQNRDQELVGHKPFKVIAERLSNNGFIVLRFDDRGIGQSEGDFNRATSLDFANDVNAAVEYLTNHKKVDPKKISLIGHSEGGIIAPIVATKRNDIASVVLLAGPGMRGKDVMIQQNKMMLRSINAPEELINKIANQLALEFDELLASDDIERSKENMINKSVEYMANFSDEEKTNFGISEQSIMMRANAFSSHWFLFYLKHDPVKVLEKVMCPVLALNGEKDTQVNAKENLEIIEDVLTKSGISFEVRELKSHNHLFQTCETGSPTEYSTIKEDISELTLQTITDWLVIQMF